MADNLDFNAARFATASMMPVGDEEANAVWMRKMAENTARAVGEWGTVIASGIGNYTATASIDIPSLGFNLVPSLDYFQLRGGSQPAMLGYYNEAGVDLGMSWWISGGTEIYFRLVPDLGIDNAGGTRIHIVDYGTWRKDFGTIIYRFRGW